MEKIYFILVGTPAFLGQEIVDNNLLFNLIKDSLNWQVRGLISKNRLNFLFILFDLTYFARGIGAIFSNYLQKSVNFFE